METNNTALQILIILKAVEAFLTDCAPKGVTITRTQCAIRIDGTDKKTLGELRQLGYRFMKNAYPTRNYKASKVRGWKFWRMQDGDLACGIEVVRTDEETKSICLGPVRGVNW